MGKKRIVKKGGEGEAGAKASSSRSSKRKIDSGVLFVEATYNNTKVSLADSMGNVILWSSSGSLGFAGAKKGTPFAAAKVGELLADKGIAMGLKEISVVVKGVGAGRESAIRAFAGKGVHVMGIKDTTPVPHNGPRPPKPRRV